MSLPTFTIPTSAPLLKLEYTKPEIDNWIAGRLGWTDIKEEKLRGHKESILPPPRWMGHPPGQPQFTRERPEFTSVQTLIQEATFKLVPEDDRDLFVGKLTLIVADDDSAWTMFNIIHASALQRSLALMGTLMDLGL